MICSFYLSTYTESADPSQRYTLHVTGLKNTHEINTYLGIAAPALDNGGEIGKDIKGRNGKRW